MKIEFANLISQIIDYMIIGSFFVILYQVFKGTKIVRILGFFLLLFVLKKVSSEFHLTLTSKILSFLLDNALILLFIVFQDEIKKFIFRISRLLSNLQTQNKDFSTASEIISQACKQLSNEQTGALIVFEKNVSLGALVAKGVPLNADISKELILAIFKKKSPLHDGAIIISNNRIVSASNFFPIKHDDNVELKYGTRHRSALGISEEADCIVIVVSEETGEMRIAENGVFSKALKSDELKIMLDQKLSLNELGSNKFPDVAYRISDWIKRTLKKNNE